MSVRAANAGDIPRIVKLCEAERRLYEGGHAHFYRVAADYAQKKLSATAKLIDGSEPVALVHESDDRIDGVVLGIVVNAPPVYDPGGRVCLIEDLFVPEPAAWPIAGDALVAAVNERVRGLGGVLLIVETMFAATAKRELMSAAGFSAASDWYCRDINLTEPAEAIAGTIEVAEPADVPRIVELCEHRRMQYQQYEPIFWRKAEDSAEKHGGLVSWIVGEHKMIVLVHRSGAAVDGFIMANPSASSPFFDRNGTSCNIDDFGVTDDDKWPVGAWLLHEATVRAKAMGAFSTQVICGHADLSKRQMLEQMGYQIGHQWLVRATSNNSE